MSKALIVATDVVTHLRGKGLAIDTLLLFVNKGEFIKRHLQPERIRNITIHLDRAASCGTCLGGRNCTMSVEAEIFYYDGRKKRILYVGHDSSRVVDMLHFLLRDGF